MSEKLPHRDQPCSLQTCKSPQHTEIFSVILKKLCDREESLPFKTSFGLTPDNVASQEIDFIVIQDRLSSGYYNANPWLFVNDLWFIFDNARMYNLPSSKVVKCCNILADIFDEDINSAMRMLGYCCGRRYIFLPPILHCSAKKSCRINKNSKYYEYQDEYILCLECFENAPGEVVQIMEDSIPSARLPKKLFSEKKNDNFVEESFVKCTLCLREFHQICVLYVEQIYEKEFLCHLCSPNEKIYLQTRIDKYSAKQLQVTELSDRMEQRIQKYLNRNGVKVEDITVRVVSSSKKNFDIKPEMKKRFVSCGIFPEKLPFTAKAILVFQRIEFVDICVFGIHVQEYDSACPSPNTRKAYISYLDSVHFFRPKEIRTQVFHQIFLGYLEHVKHLGYASVHIWASPPSQGDDYLFYRHPMHQKLPDHERLREWYENILKKGLTENIILENENVMERVIAGEYSILDVPYFENDFWTNFLEENLNIDDSTNSRNELHMNGSCKVKLSASIIPKIRSVIEENKEVFFVFKLNELDSDILRSPINDPDPSIYCDLMDGRENFLLLSKERNYEFSSLRRAKYSSIILLHELHSRNYEKFTYSCNLCKCTLRTRYHCTICDDFDLCASCWLENNHDHEMQVLKENELIKIVIPAGRSTNEDYRNSSKRSCIDALIHACLCRDGGCSVFGCVRMKRILFHFKVCDVYKEGPCPICKEVISLYTIHAKHCRDNDCIVPPCSTMKSKLQVAENHPGPSV